jgi:hypothetical protein
MTTTRKTPARKTPAKAASVKTAAKDKSNIGKWVGAGAAVGIGSAAIVAALLYTRKARDEAKPPKGPIDTQD